MAKTRDTDIAEALELFEESQEASNFNRQAYIEDIRFGRLGEQWPAEVEKSRRAESRPCLTINKLFKLTQHVVNEGRQNKPGIDVTPVDNGADENTAEVISGIMRSIERNSQAHIAYDTALDHAVSGGFGFFRIGIEYAHEDTFAMQARIHRIHNPLMVHWDTASTAFDASDWRYAFVSDFLCEEDFKARYPKADPVSFDGADDLGVNWTDDDDIRVAEYWLREEKKRKLLKLSNGNIIREDLFKDEVKYLAEINGVTVVREREATYHEVTRRVMNGVEILEEEKWCGSSIPICPVWGEEVFADGQRHFLSLIRQAKSAQEMFNYWRSATTELVALAPKAPWVGPIGAFKTDADKWQHANTRSFSYIGYDGQVPPQRQAFAGVPAGALQEAMSANEDMQALTGIYPASTGAPAPERSGRAILARERQGNISNFHFIDNLARSIGYAGKVLLEIIPHVYTERETVRILGVDMKEKVARLVKENPPGKEGQASWKAEDGGEPMYNLTVGKYDVEVKQGPSYGTQREQTRETLTDIMTQVPGAAALLGDVLMDHMDFQGADKVSKRLQMLLPPQIQAAEGIAAPQGPVAGPGLAPPNQIMPQQMAQPMQGAPQASPGMSWVFPLV